MRHSGRYIVSVVAQGIWVLLLFSILFYWARCTVGFSHFRNNQKSSRSLQETGVVKPDNRVGFKSFKDRPYKVVYKFFVENLNPPVFTLATYITSTQINLANHGNTLFLMPDSFVDQVTNKYDMKPVGFFIFSLLILPSILLAVFLTNLVRKDCVRTGMSNNAKLGWMIATILFALPAYITYRLTKPDLMFVTCGNCGRLRRCDTQLCHHCKSKWLVPELIAPAWRIKDGQLEEETQTATGLVTEMGDTTAK